MEITRLMAAVILLAAFTCDQVQAETKDQDLASESMNPLSSLIALPFENNVLFNVGPSKSTSNVLNFKPVFPTDFGKWKLINRITVPIIWAEGQEFKVDGSIDWGGGNPGSLDTGSAFGIGDITYQGFITRSKSSGPTSWGFGGSIVIPTHTKARFGTDKWSAGPAIVAVRPGEKWMFGLIAQNVWSFAGDSDAADVNTFSIQPSVNYKLGNGYYLTSAPLITANWESESDNRWAIPLGGGVGKLIKLGGRAVAIDAGAYYYIEHPRYNPDWYIQILCNFLFPKR